MYSTESLKAFKTKERNRRGDRSHEEGEIEDEESDCENHDTSERDGCYHPITTSHDDELNLHTDGEIMRVR